MYIMLLCLAFSAQTRPIAIFLVAKVYFNWLVGMLLVSRSGLVEEDAVEVVHYYGFHLSSSFMMYNLKCFTGKITMW